MDELPVGLAAVLGQQFEAGPVDQVHWVIEFASLVDEERFALRAMEDKIYFQGMVDMDARRAALVLIELTGDDKLFVYDIASVLHK